MSYKAEVLLIKAKRLNILRLPVEKPQNFGSKRQPEKLEGNSTHWEGRLWYTHMNRNQPLLHIISPLFFHTCGFPAWASSLGPVGSVIIGVVQFENKRILLL